MTQGRSIRLFLVDGTPNGLLTAEIMNWTGHVLTGPRSKLSELVQRRSDYCFYCRSVTKEQKFL